MAPMISLAVAGALENQAGQDFAVQRLHEAHVQIGQHRAGP